MGGSSSASSSSSAEASRSPASPFSPVIKELYSSQQKSTMPATTQCRSLAYVGSFSLELSSTVRSPGITIPIQLRKHLKISSSMAQTLTLFESVDDLSDAIYNLLITLL